MIVKHIHSLGWVWLQPDLYPQALTLSFFCASAVGLERNEHSIEKSD